MADRQNNSEQVIIADNAMYPTNHVVSMYALTGGAVGGGIIGVFMSIMNPLALLIFPFVGMFFGAFIGFIPALLTGVILAKLQIKRHQIGVITMVGAMVSGMYTLIYFTYNSFINGQHIRFSEIFFSLLLIMCVGLCSSCIVGCKVLPTDEEIIE